MSVVYCYLFNSHIDKKRDICQYRTLFIFVIFFRKILEITDNTFTGLSCLTRFLSSFLNIGVTSASFRLSENWCFFNNFIVPLSSQIWSRNVWHFFKSVVEGMTACYYVTYASQSESTLYSSLKVKELLARNRRDIWNIWSDSNWIRTHNHLVRKRTLNHLAKIFSKFLKPPFLLPSISEISSRISETW